MARAADLPDDIRRFILTSIPSVPYLEAVLLMRGGPESEWDAAGFSRRLYVPEKQAGELLEQLAGAGIARKADGGYRYEPATAELKERIEGLAQAYAADLVAVTDLIHSRIDKRAHQFADAFRLRKD